MAVLPLHAPAVVGGLLGAGKKLDATALCGIFDRLQRAEVSKPHTSSKGSSSGFLSSLISGPGPQGKDQDKEATKRLKLLVFLTINTTLMFVEFSYGAVHNNLGLLSDGCHMLFDNASLIIGLYAAYMATLPADHTFTYGYGRVESLAGFANGVLLVGCTSLHALATPYADPQPQNAVVPDELPHLILFDSLHLLL